MTGGTVRHESSNAAAAETAGAVTAAALVRQRARWDPRPRYRDPATLTLAAATAACNAAVAAAAVAACLSVEYLLPAAVMYGIKAVPDYLLIAAEIRKRGNRVRTLQFLASEIIYPSYFMIVAVMSQSPSAGQFRGR